MQIGRRIYFDKTTGDVILDTGERAGDVVETTIDYDFQVFIPLQNRVRETIGCIQLDYGQFQQDFYECTSYKVDVASNTLLFSYEPVTPPVFEEPLTMQIKQLKDKNTMMQSDLITMQDAINMALGL